MLRQRYRLRSKLSTTLYGAVCLCEDAQRDNALVAVKQVDLRSALAALEQCPHIDNPWHEKQAVAALQRLPAHPNILRTLAEFVHKDSWFLVMEFCGDGDLWTVLQSSPNNRLPEPSARGVFRQIAAGVRFLHSHGLAHRDLSLENVLVKGGVAKLCDFGLACDAARVCTDPVGKAYYMAPEVVAQRPYDPAAADVWALGVVLFILLTGSPLTLKATPKDDALRALETVGVRGILDAWGLYPAAVSDAAIELMASMLQVDAARRPSIETVMQHPWFAQP